MQNGRGIALLTVDGDRGRICYLVTARRIEPSTMAHIHVGAVGVAGPVVQALAPPARGFSAACVTNDQLADDLIDNPDEYYVNVHNAPYPNGVIRGQLS